MAYHSQGFEDKKLARLGQLVATVAAHQPGELPKSSPSKPPSLPHLLIILALSKYHLSITGANVVIICLNKKDTRYMEL